jgi:hypothetical protein
MPRVEHSSSQTAEENCTPLSEVSAAGTPNLLTQLLKKAAAQLVVEVLTSGTASAHLVLLSTMVSRWVQPPGEAGRGPTMSNVHVGEPLDWQLYRLNLRVHCRGHLASGTPLAVPAEAGDVRRHAPPHVAG